MRRSHSGTRRRHRPLTGTAGVRLAACLFLPMMRGCDHATPVAAVEVVLGLLLVSAIGWTGTSEVRMASTAVLMGAISAAWFALWAATPDAMIGAYLAFASSVGLFAGGLWWLVELAWQPDDRVPPAMLRRRSILAG